MTRTPKRLAASTEIGLVVGLVAVILLAMYPHAVLGDGVISVADLLYAHPPWEASRPPDYRGPSNKLLADQVFQVYPWADYARSRLRHLELPLWNPHAASGTAFLANQNAGLFSILHLPLWLASSTAIGLTLVAFLKIAVSVAGAYLLARALGAGPAGACVAGLSYGLCAQSAVWLGHPLTTVSPFLPWSLLWVDRLQRARRPARSVAALALVTGLHLLGSHPETSLHIVIATTIYAIVIGWREPDAGPAGHRLSWHRLDWRRLGWVGIGLSVGIVAASIQVLPFVDALYESYPRTMRIEHAMRWSLPLSSLPLAVAPRLYGTPMDLTHREDLAGSNFAETAWYVGILPLILIPAGWSMLHDRRRALLAILGAGGLLIAIDPWGWSGAALAHVPLVGLGAHHRLTLWWCLAASVLVGVAVDRFARGVEPARWPVRAAIAVVLGLLVGGVQQTVTGLGWSRRNFLDVGLVLGLLAVAGALLALAGSRHRAVRWLPLLVLIAQLGDLWGFGHDINPTVAPASVFPATPTTRRLADRPPHQRMVALNRVMPCNTPTVYGLGDIRGYEPLFSETYQRFWFAAVGPRGAWQELYLAEMASPSVLELLGVATIVDHPALSPLGQRTRLPVRALWTGPDANVYALDSAMPPAFLVHQFDLEPNPGAAGRRLREGYPFRERVLLDVPPDIPPAAPSPGANAAVARYTRPTPERIEIDVAPDAPGILVLTEGYDPGWTVRVDDRPAQLLRAHGTFQAVALAAGPHRVEFTYRPRLLGLGAALSAAALVAIALLATVVNRRGR